MKILRTPDACFEVSRLSFCTSLPIKTADGGDLRIHHLDEGDTDAPIVLCMHGNPYGAIFIAK